MLLVPTYVAASAIEGVGVFAAEPISAGTRIWRFEPSFDRLIPAAEHQSADPVLKAFLDRYAYPDPAGGAFMVYEVDNGRFMNHSKSPNTVFGGEHPGTALRDIAAGEELTCDYANFLEGFDLYVDPFGEALRRDVA